ncbi:MAG: HAD-IA family hydrolase [Castellaniella sp.]
MSRLVLFDFDGTLADTAPDLAAAANRQRVRRGLEPMPLDVLRPWSSMGARGLLKAALGVETSDPQYPALREQFLTDYEAGMTDQIALFPGIRGLLDTLKTHGLRWGIVTNKHEYLAVPQAVYLGLHNDCVVTVGGDTTEHIKPHPAPLLHAAGKAGIAPAHCVYVGDDQRDIIAGRAAGMATIVAAYGYCGAETAAIRGWQADAVAETVADIWPAIARWAGVAAA